jgi:glycerol-3-phosphate acyltransferase PlsX
LHEELKESVSFTFFVPSELAQKIPPTVNAVVCADIIKMEDDPLLSVKRKKNSSIVQGIQMLQKKEVDAFISAGNTGALLAASHLALPLLPGIVRAGLLTLLPTRQKDRNHRCRCKCFVQS